MAVAVTMAVVYLSIVISVTVSFKQAEETYFLLGMHDMNAEVGVMILHTVLTFLQCDWPIFYVEVCGSVDRALDKIKNVLGVNCGASQT